MPHQGLSESNRCRAKLKAKSPKQPEKNGEGGAEQQW